MKLSVVQLPDGRWNIVAPDGTVISTRETEDEALVEALTRIMADAAKTKDQPKEDGHDS